MASLQGQPNSVDLSDRIYKNIMNIPSERRPRSTKNRPASAKSSSTQLSFPACPSPRHSATTPRASQSLTQGNGTFSDFDIIKNRSWSASRVKSGHLQTRSGGGRRVDPPPPLQTPPSRGATSSQTDIPGSVPGTAGAPGENKGRQLQTRELWNLRGSQVERLHQEWAAVDQCRAMKRASEMVQHRLDPMYRISGSPMPLLARYQVNDTDLQRLRDMTETSRVLQLDLKRIKYPQGYQTPRRERSGLTKSHLTSGISKAAHPNPPSPHNSREEGEEDGEGEGGEKAEGQLHDVVTSPLSQGLAPGGAKAAAGGGGGGMEEAQHHPTSPISTPEDTPRHHPHTHTNDNDDNDYDQSQQEQEVEEGGATTGNHGEAFLTATDGD